MWLYVQSSWHTVGPHAAVTISVGVQMMSYVSLTLYQLWSGKELTCFFSESPSAWHIVGDL